MRETNKIKDIIKETLNKSVDLLHPYRYEQNSVNKLIEGICEDITKTYRQEINNIIKKHIADMDDVIEYDLNLCLRLKDNPILVRLPNDIVENFTIRDRRQYYKNYYVLKDKADKIYDDIILSLPFIKNRKELDELIKHKIEELNNFYEIFILNSGKTHEV